MKRESYFSNPDQVVEIRHFHLFCGLGGGAKGFNKASPRVGNLVGRMRCIGGIDVDAAAIRDFGRLAGVPGTVLDLFDRQQFIDFHGMEPPPGWREATPADIRVAAGNERPHIVFLSAPCKGFSGLLAENKSKTTKYVALNRLTERGVWLMLEAWADDPPELIIFENVPRIANRGRPLLDRIDALFRHYGYAVADTTHDCGKIGKLAQSRKRFLKVARHIAKVAPFLYEPDQHRLQAVGTVLGRMPLPGDPAGGPMHRVPALQWKTWVRLAMIEAGSDWRSLNRLAVEDGLLRDYLIVPQHDEAWHRNVLGVTAWDQPANTITSESRPTTGRFAVADPRTFTAREGTGFLGVNDWQQHAGTVTANGRPGAGAFSVADPRAAQDAPQYQQYGVLKWGETSGAVIGVKSPGQGTFSVADPRCQATKHNNCFRVVRFDSTAGTVTGGGHPSAGGQAVADPRRNGPTFGKYAVTAYGDSAGTVISGSTTGQGAFAVADPRGGIQRSKGDHYLTGGHYGVVPWDAASGAVSASACYDNGRWSVADPRRSETPELSFAYRENTPEKFRVMPSANDRLVCMIQSEDGTCHRPFTTFELAALQSLVDPEDVLELDGLSDQAWRERIGNAVPPEAACAIGEVMGTTLLLAWSGETFVLSATPIWVQPVAIALSLAQGGMS